MRASIQALPDLVPVLFCQVSGELTKPARIPAHGRQTARRAAITSVRTGTATASLPAVLTSAARKNTLRDLGRRRITIDRDRHRDHKTKARQAFPAAGRGTVTRKAPARITICGPLAA